jgi:hypothetical protein
MYAAQHRQKMATHVHTLSGITTDYPGVILVEDRKMKK